MKEHWREDVGRSKGVFSDRRIEGSSSLPEFYNDNRLVLLPRDPYWLFAYWELTPRRLDELARDVGHSLMNSAEWVLRLFDVTDETSGDSGRGASFTEFMIIRSARQAYLKVPRSGRVYLARLGLRLQDGRFISVLTSNRVRLPQGKVSDRSDSRFVEVGYDEFSPEHWKKLLEASGADRIGKGSAELARTMASRWEFLKSVSSVSSAASPWPTSSMSGSLTFSIPPDLIAKERS